MGNFKHRSILRKWLVYIKSNIIFYLNKTAFNVYAQTWFKEWLLLNPKESWKEVKCPILALSGEKDLQVPLGNLELIKKYAKQSGNQHIKTKSFKDLNHLFQKADKGLPEEYANIDSSISLEVLAYIENWINNRVQETKPYKKINATNFVSIKGRTCNKVDI